MRLSLSSGGGSIMLWGCFLGTGNLVQAVGILKNKLKNSASGPALGRHWVI